MKRKQDFNNSGTDSTFSTESIVKRLHSVVKDFKKSQFNCEKCNEKLITSTELSEHITTNHTNYKFKCVLNGCQFTTNYENLFQFHILSHNLEKQHKCNQIEFIKSFDSNSIPNSLESKERQIMETKLKKDNNEESVFGEQILKFFNYFNTNYLFLLSI